MSYSEIAKKAEINKAGFYQSMAKENPDFGWKQLLKISNALGVTFPRLAKQAMKETEESEQPTPIFGQTAEELTSGLTIKGKGNE